MRINNEKESRRETGMTHDATWMRMLQPPEANSQWPTMRLG
jgi:hypothetical protein